MKSKYHYLTFLTFLTLFSPFFVDVDNWNLLFTRIIISGSSSSHLTPLTLPTYLLHPFQRRPHSFPLLLPTFLYL